MALGKLLEGTAWFATLSLATVGTLTFLPDGAWGSFPTALRPVRAKLAEFGVAPACYRAEVATSAELALNDESTEAVGGGKRDGDDFWGSATTVRIGERWKNVRKVGETALSENEPVGGGEGSAREEGTTVPAGAGGAIPPFETIGAAGAFESVETVGETAANGWGDVDLNGDFSFPTANGALEGDAQLSTNEGVANVGDGVGGLENVDVDEDWGANEIPPFDEGIGASGDVVLANDELGNENAVLDGVGVAEFELTAPKEEATAAASLTETQDSGTGDGERKFEGFEGYSDFNASTPLLAEADAALPNDSATNGAFPSELNGEETPDLPNALAAASTASTPEEIKSVFVALNKIRNEQAARLAAEDAQALDAALDRLAFDVFYNPAKTILEPRWQTGPGESLASIAQRLATTPETLAEINGLKTPIDAPLPIGTTLKTVRGPVSAEISVAKKELTLRLNGLYAGRFALGVPENSASLRGDFRVVEKLTNPNCDAVDSNGQTIAIPGGAPENPLGSAWIALDGGVGLQGTNRPELVGRMIPENGGFVFSNREISQLSVLLPIGAVVSIVD